MLDLEKIHSKPVSVIRIPYDVRNYIKIPEELNKANEGDIYSLVEYENKSPAMKKMEEKKLFFINFEELREILLTNLKDRRENVDFCSVIIINDIHISVLEKLIIIGLWTELYKISKRRPYLIITSVSEYIPSLPFTLSTENCQNLFLSPDERKFYYHDNNCHPNSKELTDEICQKVYELHRSHKSSKAGSIWVVFYPNRFNFNKMLYDKFGKEAIIISEKFIQESENIFDSDERIIIIAEGETFNKMLVNKIDGVIDSVTTKNADNINYSSKELCEIRASQIKKGFIYRMCTEEYYKDLPMVSLRTFPEKETDLNYIKIISSGIDPKAIFSSIIDQKKMEEDLERLEELGLFSGGNITEIGILMEKTSLSAENCNLLYHWYTSGKPIFPCIVACVISELESPLNSIPVSKDVFTNYLEHFNEILKREDDFNLIRSDNFFQCLEKIKDIIKNINKMIKVDIGNYNSKNLMDNLRPLMEKSYTRRTYKLMNKKEGIYSNGSKIFKVKPDEFGYEMDKFPYKIFEFHKVRINDNPSSIQRGKNYITYFAF